MRVKVAQSFPTLCNPMDCTVHRILQASILEWAAFPFRGSLLNVQLPIKEAEKECLHKLRTNPDSAVPWNLQGSVSRTKVFKTRRLLLLFLGGHLRLMIKESGRFVLRMFPISVFLICFILTPSWLHEELSCFWM